MDTSALGETGHIVVFYIAPAILGFAGAAAIKRWVNSGKRDLPLIGWLMLPVLLFSVWFFLSPEGDGSIGALMWMILFEMPVPFCIWAVGMIIGYRLTRTRQSAT